jgi:transcriptional regulator with XRE-family HTH domain
VKNPLFVQAFGEHLRTLRVRKGLSQHELADEADLSWSTIIRIEKGRLAATIDVLASVARALQMPLWVAGTRSRRAVLIGVPCTEWYEWHFWYAIAASRAAG